MSDKIYHFVPPQDPENGIGEVDRAIADRYGNIIDETYFTSSIAYTKEEVDALIEAAQVGVQWGKITGTLSDQTDLQAALDAKQGILSFDDTPTSGSLNPVTSDGIFRANQLLREVAEGKCKSFTASYQLTLSEMQTLAQQGDLTIYDGQGTNVTDSIIDGSHMVFIDWFLNPSLNSQASSIGILTEYIAVGDPLSGSIILDTHSGLNLKTGDIILVIETDVPDRWYASNNDSLYILETAKIDLSTYMTTNTAQNIFAQKTIMYPYVFLMQSNWTNYFMQLSASEQGVLNVAVKPAIGNATIRYKLGGNAFTPESGSISLGSSSKKWTDVFMSGVLSDGNSSYGLALPDTTSFTANKTIATTDDISNMMTTDTDQPVSGVKTIESEIDFSNTSTQVVWATRQNQYGNLEFARNNAGLYSFATSGFFPNSNNARDLGASALRWKNLHLSGDINPNSVTISDIDANLTDIESKTMHVNGITTIVFYCKVINYINAGTILFKTNQKPTHIVNFTGRNQASGTYNSASAQFMINTNGEIIVLASAAANNEICFTLIY